MTNEERFIRCSACGQLGVRITPDTKATPRVRCERCGALHVTKELLAANDMTRKRDELDQDDGKVKH